MGSRFFYFSIAVIILVMVVSFMKIFFLPNAEIFEENFNSTQKNHEKHIKDPLLLSPRKNDDLSSFSARVQRERQIRFKNFLQNFGDESQFWWFWDFGIDFKILEKVCDACAPILGPILENFDHRILVKSQSYDKPPWRNFDFLSNFVEIENFGF